MGLITKKHSIGKTIAALRKEKGWTQVELAGKLQVSDKAVSKWEKDDAAPSVEFFPALAELFGVSIDYLMTGKVAEKEIITMSKIELCAKKDDPTLLGNFSVDTRDESGRSLMDYIKKYESLKVLKALFDRCSHQTQYMGLFGWSRGRGIAPSDYLMLVKINGERKYMQEVCRSEVYIYSVSDIEKSGYMSTIKYLIAHYQELPTDQKEYYFGKENVLKPNAAWINAYPYFLQEAYAQGKKEAFNDLLEKITATNSAFLLGKERLRQTAGSWFEHEFMYWKENQVYIYVLRETIEAAYRNGDIELGDKLNSICKTPLSNYDKKVIALDLDKTLSTKEKQFQKMIHDGVLCIDELLETKDLPFIKTALLNNPIHIIEKVYKDLQESRWRDLFEFMVDNSLNAESVIQQSKAYIEASLLGYWNSNAAEKCINSKHLYVNERNQTYGLLAHSAYGGSRQFKAKTLAEVIEKLQLCKQQILNEYCWKLDKEKTIGDLTKEYFEKELSQGNTEMVIIKLCVRLEAILRSDYHYEGDFSDMLDKYCSFFNTTDDEGNDYDPYTPTILNKLRMQRNGIVHSKKCTEELSIGEIKFCIDYICKMG